MAAAFKISDRWKAIVAAGVTAATNVVLRFAGVDSDAFYLVGVVSTFLAGIGVYYTTNSE